MGAEELLALLSLYPWSDITGEEGTDPEAAESLAAGMDTRLKPVFVLSRYAEGTEYALTVISNKLDEPKAVTKDQDQIAWLYEQVTS